MDDLETANQYLVNMSVSICFEYDQACDPKVVVFENTLLHKLPCLLATGFHEESKFFNLSQLHCFKQNPCIINDLLEFDWLTVLSCPVTPSRLFP